MDLSQMVSQGLQYMGIGVGVVFVVLGVFFGVIKLLQKIFTSKEAK